MRKVDLRKLRKFTMGPGVGFLESNLACVVAQANIIDTMQKGKEIVEVSDSLRCACPLLRHVAIALNDGPWWDSDQERTKMLRPLIPLLLDSRVSPKNTIKRAKLMAEFAQKAAKASPIREHVEDADEAVRLAKKSGTEGYAMRAMRAASIATSIAEEARDKCVTPIRDELIRTWKECAAIR